jgi:hypothetical protein
MSCGCGGGCGPGPCPSAPRETVFDVPNAECYSHSLGRLAIGVADRLRNLNTKFGMRPYVVRWVRSAWSGGIRSRGEESILCVETILPVPLLLDLKTLVRVVNPIGIDENGGVMVTEISGCYTEEHLRGLDDDGTSIPADQNFYYEIEFLRADGRPSDKRRFFPSGAPEYVPDDFCWTLKLERQRQDRRRDGSAR